MDGSNLIIDKDVLLRAATRIEQYCNTQDELIRAFQAQVKAQGSEWRDDQTFGKLYDEISRLREGVSTYFLEMKQTFSAFFRRKAEQIDSLR